MLQVVGVLLHALAHHFLKNPPGNDHISPSRALLSRWFSKIPLWWDMGVSKNRGIPKWMVYDGKPYVLMDDLGGPPLFLETPIWIFTVPWRGPSCPLPSIQARPSQPSVERPWDPWRERHSLPRPTRYLRRHNHRCFWGACRRMWNKKSWKNC